MTHPPLSSADSLPHTIRALGWTSFLTDLSSEAIYPLLPAFVRGLGGTSIDIGLIDGIATAVAAVVRLPSGTLSDWIGRRPLVLWGYAISLAVAARPRHGSGSRTVLATSRAAPADERQSGLNVTATLNRSLTQRHGEAGEGLRGSC